MSDAPTFTFLGANYELIKSIDHEVVDSGPRDTGKTWAACAKARLFCNVPKSQGTIIRKTYADMKGTVLLTWDRVLAGSGVRKIGGTNPQRYIFPNGATVWIAGLDKPGKALSSERDWIYVNQAEELTLDDWETLAGCCSGRGAVVAHPQLFGDCNPAGPKHWIKERAKTGQLRLLSASHKDNPSLYRKDGSLTAEGEKRLAVLAAYTGVRRLRYFEGLWVIAEGAVYENFDSTPGKGHVRHRDPQDMKVWYLALDEGFTHPSVVLLIGEDGDGRWHIFRELYVRGWLQGRIVEHTANWFKDVRKEFNALEYYHRGIHVMGETPVICSKAAVDQSAAGFIADLKDAGVRAIGAPKGADSVENGIARVRNRLEFKADGLPRLTIDPSCVETINEFESYQYEKNSDKPKKENDHSMDAIRYLENLLAEPTGAIKESTDIKAATMPAGAHSITPRHWTGTRTTNPRSWPVGR